jgi:hypothetical protein
MQGKGQTLQSQKLLVIALFCYLYKMFSSEVFGRFMHGPVLIAQQVVVFNHRVWTEIGSQSWRKVK